MIREVESTGLFVSDTMYLLVYIVYFTIDHNPTDLTRGTLLLPPPHPEFLAGCLLFRSYHMRTYCLSAEGALELPALRSGTVTASSLESLLFSMFPLGNHSHLFLSFPAPCVTMPLNISAAESLCLYPRLLIRAPYICPWSPNPRLYPPLRLRPLPVSAAASPSPLPVSAPAPPYPSLYLSINGLFTIESTMQEYFYLCTRVF